jgi:AmiR/NasT family two-component response regulator
MVTAVNQQGPIMEALKAGARAFVVKPFQPKSVKAALKKLTSPRLRT